MRLYKTENPVKKKYPAVFFRTKDFTAGFNE